MGMTYKRYAPFLDRCNVGLKLRSYDAYIRMARVYGLVRDRVRVDTVGMIAFVPSQRSCPLLMFPW